MDEEQEDNLKAVLMDMAGEIADLKEKQPFGKQIAPEWFEEISEAIRVI
jgi:hypothetical protein